MFGIRAVEGARPYSLKSKYATMPRLCSGMEAVLPIVGANSVSPNTQTLYIRIIVIRAHTVRPYELLFGLHVFCMDNALLLNKL